MATYLDKILDAHRSEARGDQRSTDALMERVADIPPTRGFRAALLGGDTLGVISEVKRRSPSKGDLLPGLDPAALARVYRDAGANCLSVLTDREYFGGSPEDLAAARGAVEIPVLRKDFTVSANDVCDARLMGADCVLLIVAALDDNELRDFSQLAREVGLDVLVEIHDEAELERAMASTEGDLIGVNQRDLLTFEVDQERAVRVAGSMEPRTVKVAESGVRGRDDANALAGAGYSAVLVGEHLVTAAVPGAALADLRVPLPSVD
ncbi:MAG TPA: indole-3-glycerol phosphate synthase TrpC [Microthrixaceae bacterium]|nr:indole-3-glycerol phosphate synthase TrpC [Microthrixaceae bacterium]